MPYTGKVQAQGDKIPKGLNSYSATVSVVSASTGLVFDR